MRVFIPEVVRMLPEGVATPKKPNEACLLTLVKFF